jgi:hypothetical protein
MTTTQKKNCKGCKERYPACQDTCPNKSPGTTYTDPEKEYRAYQANLFNKNKRQLSRMRGKH